MIFQYVSDIHLEFYEKKTTKFNFLKPSAPILILAGDICCCASNADFEILKRFLDEVCNMPYKHILFVPGNHEYYNNGSNKQTVEMINAKIQTYFIGKPKLVYLNQKIFKYVENGVNYIFIGATLWTYIPEKVHSRIKHAMSDYDSIYTGVGKKITPNDISKMFDDDFLFLKRNIEKYVGNKIIVVTHHKPYRSKDYLSNEILFAYESDCSMIFNGVCAWVYGHTHVKDKTRINHTMFLSNPKGYPYQKTRYENNITYNVN